jgi:hypothetical protein
VFFRIVARLFSTEFEAGATALLVSYDDDAGPAACRARGGPGVERTRSDVRASSFPSPKR